MGKIVANMRGNNSFLKSDPNLKQWLIARGWVDSEPDAHWEDVMYAFEEFHSTHGHLRVPRNAVVNGIRLGQLVNRIRTHHCFVQSHPERAQWFYEHGFVMHTRDAGKNAVAWEKLGVTTGLWAFGSV